MVPEVGAARWRYMCPSITDLCHRLPTSYILYIGSNAWLHHIAEVLLWSAKTMTNRDENETRRNVDGGFVKITIIKYTMQYCWRIKRRLNVVYKMQTLLRCLKKMRRKYQTRLIWLVLFFKSEFPLKLFLHPRRPHFSWKRLKRAQKTWFRDIKRNGHMEMKKMEWRKEMEILYIV